jgi:hypothetical protein
LSTPLPGIGANPSAGTPSGGTGANASTRRGTGASGTGTGGATAGADMPANQRQLDALERSNERIRRSVMTSICRGC